MKFRGVIFDMDGTTLDTERYSLPAWQSACQELGYEMDERLFRALIGRRWAENLMTLQQALGESFPVEEARRLTRAHIAKRFPDGVKPIKSGIPELLSALELHGIRRAIATSTEFVKASESLQKAGLASRFDTIIGGDQVERGKPDPDIFLLAAERLGIRPDEALVLEDSDPGIRGARAAGMEVILIPDLAIVPEESAKMCFAICENAADVVNLLS